MKLSKITVCADLAGCPNRCRHCWIGHTPNGAMTPDDLRAIAAAFRPLTKALVVYDWYREPDYRDDYRELWDLCNELSDLPRDHFELMSVWRAVRDLNYVPWLASLGLKSMQLTIFGGRETTDRYTGRKGAYDDILACIEQLIEHKIAPRIQYFAFTDTVGELSYLEYLIDSLRLEERCKAFGGEFSCFVHGGSCDGAGERLYGKRITETELFKIPPRVASYTLRHFDESALQDVFGKPESALYARLLTDQSTDSFVEDEPVFYVDHKWDVYPNITATEPAWRLGNLCTDGAESIVQAYLQSRSLGQKTRLQTPLCEIVRAVGDPDGRGLFDEGDYVQYCLNRYLRENGGAR